MPESSRAAQSGQARSGWIGAWVQMHRIAIVASLVAVFSAPNAALAQSTISVPLHLPATTDPSAPAEDTIEDLALALLGSASLNSARHAEDLQQSVPSIHARYRQVVAGDCLVLTYDSPVTIETMGGKVSAYEIVIGLGRPDYADAVFTIDASGRIVAHEKYSGSIAAELRQATDAALGAR